MAIDRRLAVGALGLALLVAACGGSSTSSPSAQPAASQPVAASPVPSEAAQSEAAPSAVETGPVPSFQAGAAGDLEATLPDEAGGLTFTKTSFDGSQLGASGFGMDAGQLDPILKANGKTISDVRMAIATAAGAGAGTGAAVIALQVQGMDASKLIDIATANQGAGGAATKATIAGKDVLRIDAGGFSTVIYTKDDVLYEVFLASPDVAEAIVTKLP